MPFFGWWAITEGSSGGLHGFHCHSVNIWLEKGPAGRQSRCCFQKMPWRLSKHWNRCVWQFPIWLSLITLIHSCWRLMHPRRDWRQLYHRSRQMVDTTLLPMAAGPLSPMRRTTTELSLNSWCLSGLWLNISRSTCPISLSWWKQITVHRLT